jgi:hypothetical protein
MADVHDLKQLSAKEMDLRRYEARMGVWKVVLGTLIVGLAGVIIPAAITFYNAVAENYRKEAELKLATQNVYQQYIKDFLNTAVNQDIELRLRFANYFAFLSGKDQKALWDAYFADLKRQREEGRKRITTLEAQLVDLKATGGDKSEPAKYDQTSRELNWAYAEIGYAPLNRSVVAPGTGKKERLYNETTDIVERLANSRTAISEQSPDFIRFWELYRRELIGTESREFAQTMVRIGDELNLSKGSVPKDELRKLSDELVVLKIKELRNDARKD